MSVSIQLRLPDAIAKRLEEMCARTGFTKTIVVGNLINASYERANQQAAGKTQLPAYIRELREMKVAARTRHTVLAVAKRHNLMDRYWDLLPEVASRMDVNYSKDADDTDLREEQFRGFEHVWAERPAWILRREEAQREWRERQIAVAQSRYGAPDPVTPSNPKTLTPEQEAAQEQAARRLFEVAGLNYDAATPSEPSDDQSDD